MRRAEMSLDLVYDIDIDLVTSHLRDYLKNHGLTEDKDYTVITNDIYGGDDRALTAAVARADKGKWATFFINDHNVAAKIGVVGKGVCYDTGGLSLKDNKDMVDMHHDKLGAAIAVDFALKHRDIPVVVTLVNNLIGPEAMRPGEFVSSYGGIVRITHTDGEGRLILAEDLKVLTDRYPEIEVVLVGTLTDASFSMSTGLPVIATDNKKLQLMCIEANGKGDMKIWPLYPDNVRAHLSRHDLADVDNVNLSYGCNSGWRAFEFLKYFYSNIHLMDVAGLMTDGTGSPLLSPINGVELRGVEELEFVIRSLQ